MNSARAALATMAGFVVLLLHSTVADAAEIKMFSAYVTRSIMDEVKPGFEQASGHKLSNRFTNRRGMLKRIRSGEIPDVVLTNQEGIDELLKEGRVLAGNVTLIARSGLGVAVRKGAPRPDISSPDALKRTLLAAQSITYNNPAAGGASSSHFAKVLERLGIAKDVQAKTTFSNNNAGFLVAAGKAEIGVTQMSSLMRFKGVEIVGPLPRDLQANIVYAAAILSGAKNADAAKVLVSFLRGPGAAKAIKSSGMEPD